MKTRRNKQNEFQSLEELKSIREISQTTLLSLINAMKQREELKYHNIQINHFIFEEEVRISNGLSTSDIEEKWKKELSELTKIQVPFMEKPTTNSIVKEGPANGKPNGVVNENTDPNPIKPKATEHNTNRIRKPIKATQTKTTAQTNEIQISHTKAPPTGGTKPTKGEINLKSITKIKETELKEEEDNYLKLRIRMNRSNQIVVDRYLQKKKSFNPFDDTITNEIKKYKILNDDFLYNVEQEENFETLYNKFLKTTLNNYNLFSDSEEDGSIAQNQIKNFQTAHKQFLKQKRGHN